MSNSSEQFSLLKKLFESAIQEDLVKFPGGTDDVPIYPIKPRWVDFHRANNDDMPYYADVYMGKDGMSFSLFMDDKMLHRMKKLQAGQETIFGQNSKVVCLCTREDDDLVFQNMHPEYNSKNVINFHTFFEIVQI